VLYPPGTPSARRLARYVEAFDTVELNASFYRWPKDSTFEGWRDQLPDGFTMSVKAHRGLTHYRRLASPEPWIERFERCWQLLGDRHGVLLVQLHPEQQRDDARLDSFLQLMPASIRVAVELRHPSWNDPAVFELLERHRAAYVVMSGLGLECIPRATTDLVYIRMHGRIPRPITPVPTPLTICGAGPSGSPLGTVNGRTCGCISTTTWAGTRSATLSTCASCWAERPRVG
jgi:uncharacterized protein YecE (DUF72 family)